MGKTKGRETSQLFNQASCITYWLLTNVLNAHAGWLSVNKIYIQREEGGDVVKATV